MKPLLRSARHSSNYLLATLSNISNQATVACIKGSTKELGIAYKDALIVLYNKADLSTIAVRKVDSNGDYQFLGLNTQLNCFVVALSLSGKNARIFDNITPE